MASASATTVMTARAAKARASWAVPLGGRGGWQRRPRTPPLPDGPTYAADPDQQGHERDIGELEPAVEAVDILAQSPFHLAQLAPGRQHVAAELLDGLAVTLADDGIAAFARTLELGELILHFFEFGG